MRLRQAHAILEAAIALEASGLGVEMVPFDYDKPGSCVDVDHMTGFAEFTDPDTPGRDARTYNIDLKPSSDGKHVEVYLTYGFDPDGGCLLYGKRSVAGEDPDEPRFRGLVGADIAERVVEEIRKHEQSFRAAYEERSGKEWTDA
ncbi:hypothetical protein ACIHCX_03405 [Streptomyces sp. NPDC052043]|uniref:hypothetical protein n=1 Tax=Streptomyces sp. NPDC052043 TaxID=3365684 RepID=UPI0037CF25CE